MIQHQQQQQRQVRSKRRINAPPSSFLVASILFIFIYIEANAAAAGHGIASSASSASTSVFQPSPRIIDGFETSDTRYPYAVSLSYFGEHFCGGALIAPDVVITAGHCNGAGLPVMMGGGGDDSTTVSYSVVVGKHDISLFSSNANDDIGEILSVRSEIRHPNYNPETVDNDFNLVFLSDSVSRQTTSVYLRLNNDNSLPYVGSPLTVVGWGDTNADVDITTTSNVLMETVVYSMSNEVCEQSSGFVDASSSSSSATTGWEDGGKVLTGLMGGITENMMCAAQAGTDACQVSAHIKNERERMIDRLRSMTTLFSNLKVVCSLSHIIWFILYGFLQSSFLG